jgi:acetyl-CoA acetyltransferase family protein
MDVVIGGGVEAMSRVPIGSTTDHGPGEAYGPVVHERFHFIHQGLAAEAIAQRWDISRQAMDRFALESHDRAARAIAEGRFDNEIVPLATRRAHIEDKVAQAGSDEGDPADEGPLTFDEGVRAGSTYEKLASLPPAFAEDGRITAASSSQISDGAAAALIMSEEKAAACGLVPRARFHTMAVAANDPVIMLTAPIPATTLVLGKSKLTLDDIDLVEINEAFASVVLAWEKEHHPDMTKVNVNGGAIAIGHPTGGSGARLLATLLNEMERTGARYGLQTMCEGGGQANATIIERLG